MFGQTRTAKSTRDPRVEDQLHTPDRRGDSVIPLSGKTRDLIGHLPRSL
jgi:hypothetical protein